MKVRVKYRWLRLTLFVPISLALFVVRRASKRKISRKQIKAIKTELKKAKKTYRKLELANIAVENEIKVRVWL